ncbi:MAG: DsrE family protein [Bacillota bacterium]
MAKERLNVLWTSGDKDVALNMMFMYILNSIKHDWWEEVNLIIWGPSAKLVAEDRKIQEKIAEGLELGITIEACRACASNYNAADRLEEMGIEVKYMGEPSTAYIKSDSKVITF